MMEERRSELMARRDEVAAELASIDADLGTDGGWVSSGLVANGRPKRGPGRPPGKRGPGRPKGSGRGPGRPKGSGKRGRKPGPKGQSDLHNAIRAVLKGSSEPMKLADIATAVKKNGYATKSKHFPMIVGMRLTEMADAKKAGRGLYTLK
jgi:hypothetical protein